MRKATFTDTTVTFTEQFTVVDAQDIRYWDCLTEDQLEQFKILAPEWEKGFMSISDLLDKAKAILCTKKETNTMKVTVNIFGRVSEVEIDNLNKKGLKAIYDILHINWRKAFDRCQYDKADRIEEDMKLVGRMFRSI